MATSKREKELARMRAERQAARRAAAAARRRQRNMVVASVVAVALVALGAIFLASKVGRDKGDDSATPNPTASASASKTPSQKPGTCTYTKSSQKAVKEVLYPPITDVETTQVYVARINTNLGQIEIELNTPDAPCTVNNFRSLLARHFYDNTPCHRLTTQGIYVLQCGDPSGKGTGGPGYTFNDENLKGAKYPRGTVAMANSGPGTNGSQFFLVYKDTQLDPNYTPFGTITKGLDILEKVAAGGSTPDGDGKPKIAIKILNGRAVPKKA